MVTRYGLIGCGGAGTNRHLPAVEANPRTSLEGVCDLNEERVNSVARTWGVNPYTDATAMVEEERLDAVSVATPPQTHLDVLNEIIKTGVSLLVEKPFATNLNDARTLLRQVNDDQVVTEINNQLFQPVVKRAGTAIEQGAIGSIEQVYTHSSIPDLEHFLRSHPVWIKSLPGNVFGENLPHWIYLTRRFIGDVNSTTVQVSAAPAEYEIEFDEVLVQLTGEEANGELRMAVDTTASNFMMIVGNEGTMIVDLDNRVNYIISSPSGAVDVLKNNLSNAIVIASQTLERAITHGMTVGLRHLPINGMIEVTDRAYRTDGHYQQLTELVQENKQNITVAPDDILNNARTYESIVKSLEERS